MQIYFSVHCDALIILSTFLIQRKKSIGSSNIDDFKSLSLMFTHDRYIVVHTVVMIWHLFAHREDHGKYQCCVTHLLVL